MIDDCTYSLISKFPTFGTPLGFELAGLQQRRFFLQTQTQHAHDQKQAQVQSFHRRTEAIDQPRLSSLLICLLSGRPESRGFSPCKGSSHGENARAEQEEHAVPAFS